jgi:hypothetical protein
MSCGFSLIPFEKTVLIFFEHRLDRNSKHNQNQSSNNEQNSIQSETSISETVDKNISLFEVCTTQGLNEVIVLVAKYAFLQERENTLKIFFSLKMYQILTQPMIEPHKRLQALCVSRRRTVVQRQTCHCNANK